MITALDPMGAVRRTIERAGPITVTIEREVGRLFDPLKSPLLLEVSGAHSMSAPTLTIAPQATFSMRGEVLTGASVTVTGHVTVYVTTADAAVDETSPDTLALSITPGLEAALSGGEAVTISEGLTQTYSGRYVRDSSRTPRFWSITGSDWIALVDYEGKPKPEPGQVVTTPTPGMVRNVNSPPYPYCMVHVGGQVTT